MFFILDSKEHFYLPVCLTLNAQPALALSSSFLAHLTNQGLGLFFLKSTFPLHSHCSKDCSGPYIQFETFAIAFLPTSLPPVLTLCLQVCLPLLIGWNPKILHPRPLSVQLPVLLPSLNNSQCLLRVKLWARPCQTTCCSCTMSHPLMAKRTSTKHSSRPEWLPQTWAFG